MNLPKNSLLPTPLPPPAGIDEKAFAGVCALLQSAKKILFASHSRPDGDTLGSVLALYHALAPEKEIALYCCDPVPYMYRFLPHADKFNAALPDLAQYDAIFMVDVGQTERVSEEFAQAVSKNKNLPLGVIDHHPAKANGSRLELIFPKAASVGEIVFYVIEALGKPITPEIAEALYCAIHTDTGGFSYSSVGPYSLAVALKLVESGIDIGAITKAIYDSQPLSQIRLLSKTLETLDIFCEGRAAAIFITKKTYAETGGNEEMTERFVNIPRSINGVVVALAFKELEEPNTFKVSVRSVGDYDVNELARKFGGGGHKNASGLTLNGSLEEVRNTVYEAVRNLLNA